MKVGILTFWQTEDNYGQLLQCYATQCYLRSLGHETFLVRTTDGHAYNPTFKEQCFGKLRTAYRLLPYPGYLCKRGLTSLLYLLLHGRFRKRKIDRGFARFRTEYLHCTEVYTLQQLMDCPPEADAFVVGSDQIWNTVDGIYFLNWAKAGVRKIAYAASFGSRRPSEDFCNLIRPWLKRFDLISVREQSGIGICKLSGREDAICVPDPTMLLSAENYLSIASDNYPKEKYLFVYFLGTRTEIDWKEIHAFAKRKNLKIVYVASQGQEDKFEKTEASIPDWLALIAHAEYVLTNSFHGTVFALIFGRKFITYPIVGVAAKMNDRITTLLDPLALSDRIYCKRIGLSKIEDKLDYTTIHRKMAINSVNGRELLKSL